MERNENLTKERRPTMLQLQYLITLEKVGNKRGAVAQIAEICGVNHAPVSRYLKSCREKGYLTEKYEFTELGEKWLEGNKKLIEDVKEYLHQMSVPEADIEDNTRRMIENIDAHVLLTMVHNDQHMRRKQKTKKWEYEPKNFLSDVLEKGVWDIYFAFFQINHAERIQVSMANRGFKKPATIRHNRRGSWLELTPCEVQARSRIDGSEMTGSLGTLKYEYNGILCEAEKKDGKVRIPLEACHFQRKSDGKMKGMISVTLASNVARSHMPESTAILSFWL